MSNKEPKNEIKKIIDFIINHTLMETNATLNWRERDRLIKESEQSIKQLITEAELRAVREDRLHNARFWKSNIDKMFDKEIATYEDGVGIYFDNSNDAIDQGFIEPN